MPSGAETASGNLDEEARSRVAAKTDVELAELHGFAESRVSNAPDDEAAYWSALQTAIVQEAASRPRVR